MGSFNSKPFFVVHGVFEHTCLVWVHPLSGNLICFHWDAFEKYNGMFKANRDELLARGIDWEDLGSPEKWFSLENAHSILKKTRCPDEQGGVHMHQLEGPRPCIKAKLTKASLIIYDPVKRTVTAEQVEKNHLYLVSMMTRSAEKLYHPVTASF
jgi:hypothetical protein